MGLNLKFLGIYGGAMNVEIDFDQSLKIEIRFTKK
jgi:hypothetical protein